jgi:hypothetical protein
MGFTPFHHAAIAGDAGAIDALSKAGADAGSMNHMGITPLMLASTLTESYVSTRTTSPTTPLNLLYIYIYV